MRAWELLTEGERPDVESDLEDLLIAAKANDLTDLNVEDLVDQLNDMGHSVTPDSLISMIDELELELIDTATLNTVKLKGHTVDDDDDGETFDSTDDEWDEEEVSSENIARKSAMKKVKDRAAERRKAAKDAQI